MSMIRLSIIVPVYNVEKFIRPCMESIFNQGLQEDEFEVILVDDGCTDGTIGIVSEITQSHSNIRIIQQKNQGPSVARNNGIKHAKGKYILFVDSDDLLIANSIQPMLRLAIEKNLDILKANAITIDNKDVMFGNYPKFADWQNCSNGIISGEKGFIEYYHPDGSYVYINLFSKEFLVENNLQMIQGVSFAEDVAFTVHTYLKAKRFLAIPYTHYIYRRNDTSIMSTMNVNKLMGMNKVITYLYKLKDESKLSVEGEKKLNETIHACLSVSLWYLSHYVSLYPHRMEVINDLKGRLPELSFHDNLKQRITTFVYKYMPSTYITFRYLTAKRKYNQ